MIEKFGDMWEVFGEPGSRFIFTGNSFIRKDGALVMGRGLAKQVKETCPGIDFTFGRLIKSLENPRLYGLIWAAYELDMIGAFQVKSHFKNPASLNIIEHSTDKLRQFATRVRPELIYNLNYPGIGNGRLAIEQVEPIISLLPDNVHVWRYEP